MTPYRELERLQFVGRRGRGKTRLFDVDGFGLYLIALFRGRDPIGQPIDLETHYAWLQAFYARRSPG